RAPAAENNCPSLAWHRSATNQHLLVGSSLPYAHALPTGSGLPRSQTWCECRCRLPAKSPGGAAAQSTAWCSDAEQIARQNSWRRLLRPLPSGEGRGEGRNYLLRFPGLEAGAKQSISGGFPAGQCADSLKIGVTRTTIK